MQDCTTMEVCPVCGGVVARRPDGSLFPHQRYADGAGYGPDQSHDMIYCESGAPIEADGLPGGATGRGGDKMK